MSSEISRLTLEIDSNGVVKANGNLDLFKKKAEDAKKAASQFETFGSDLKANLFGSMTAANLAADGIRKLGSTAVEFVQSSLQASGQLEMIRANLETVMGSAGEAEKAFASLKDFAARTPFEMPGITESAIMLKQSGVAADELINTLQMLGDAAGGSQEKLDRIALNYAQIQSLGKAATMDIKQFAMAGLPIYATLAEITGKTGDELGEMITKGEITKDVITEAFRRMTSEGGTFFDGMARGAATLDGKLSTLEDSWKSFKAEFADSSGLTDSVKGFADNLTITLNEMTEAMENHRIAREALEKQAAGEAITTKEELAIVTQRYKDLEGLQKSILLGLGLLSPAGRILGRAASDSLVFDDARSSVNSNIAAVTHKDAMEKLIAGYMANYNKELEKAKKNQNELTGDNDKIQKWQDVLKRALNLEEVTTGAKAIADYKRNLEDSLHGAIAYAQMTGESVKDVYVEYGNKIRSALSEILSSGQFNVFDNAVTELRSLEKSFSVNFGISNQSLFDDDLFSSSGKPSDSLKQSYIEMITEAQAEAAKNGDWSGYAKNTAIVSGYQSIQGTDAGNFMQGMSQGGWQQGIINMVIGAFMKNLEDIESFQRALNLVTEAIKPAAEMVGMFTDALEPLMDAAVIGGEIGQQLAEVTLMIEPIIPVIKIIASVIYYISKVLQMGMNAIESAFSWLFGDITDGMNDFADAMYDSTKSAEEQADATSDLIDELKALREQLREDQLYYASQNTSLNAAQIISSVNDAIIAPGGRIISTAPDDYLIATKTPGSLGSGGNRITITVVNNAGDVAEADAVSTERADGMTEILVMVDKRVANGIAAGTYDTALSARDRRMAGRRISV